MYNAHLCTDTAGKEETDVCIMHIYVQIPLVGRGQMYI